MGQIKNIKLHIVTDIKNNSPESPCDTATCKVVVSMAATKVPLDNEHRSTFTFRRPSPAIQIDSLPSYPVFSFPTPTPALDIQHLPKHYYHFNLPSQVIRASKSNGMIFRNPFIREREYVFSKPLLKMIGSGETFVFGLPQPAIEASKVARSSGEKTYNFHPPLLSLRGKGACEERGSM